MWVHYVINNSSLVILISILLTTKLTFVLHNLKSHDINKSSLLQKSQQITVWKTYLKQKTNFKSTHFPWELLYLRLIWHTRHNKAQWVVHMNEYSCPWNFSSTNTKICTAQDKFSLKNEIHHLVMKVLYKNLKFTPSELPKKIKKCINFPQNYISHQHIQPLEKKISQHSGKEKHYFSCV